MTGSPWRNMGGECMKKLLIALFCLLLAGLCGCGQIASEKMQTTTTLQENNVQSTTKILTIQTEPTGVFPTTQNKPNESKPYAKEINEIIKAHADRPEQTTYVRFALHDIDGDGKKELLLGLTDWGFTTVYTVQDGVAVMQRALLIDTAENLPPRLFANGTIRRDSNINGRIYYDYFHFENGELKFYSMLLNDNGNLIHSFTKHIIDGTQITKEEFDRLQKEMEGDGQVVDLDWKPLAEYGR